MASIWPAYQLIGAQWYRIDLITPPDGVGDPQLEFVPISASAVPNGTSNPSSASTQTVQQVVNYASAHTELMPLAGVGGYSSEPALSIANDALGEILAPPFAWKFNRVNANLFVTGHARQDSQFAGACAFVAESPCGVGIDLATNNGVSESGNTVTVNTLDPHNFAVGQTVYMTGNTVAAYNSTNTATPTGSSWSGGWVITAVPSSTSFRFTHASSGLAVSGSAGIFNFGWLESASMVDANDRSAPRSVLSLQASRTLPVSGIVSTPTKVAVSDNGNGIITVRTDCVGGSTPWAISLVYQAKAPTLLTLDSTWAPIPDQFAFVYRQVFLAAAFRFVNSNRADNEYKKAQAMIMKALGRDDAEMSDEYITPQVSLLGDFGGGW